MNILLSNDDGIHAPGIRAMADALRKIANVTIVAPDSNRSAASSSLTLVKPLQPLHLESGDYCVNGTPADCVHIALNGFLSGRIDLVVSGINAGANLGDDVLYSGTVAAAFEGRHLGLPSIAVNILKRQPVWYANSFLNYIRNYWANTKFSILMCRMCLMKSSKALKSAIWVTVLLPPKSLNNKAHVAKIFIGSG